MHEEETANGLLLLVSGDGIPLLVRPYGEVSTPPSAAVGVASALYHAAKRDKCDSNGAAELLALETKHRSIVYEMATMDFLLVFVSDKVCDGCKSSDAMTRRMLRTVLGALLLLLGERNLRDWDVSKLRAAVAKRMEVVDTIVKCFQTDPRFIFGRPVRNVTSYRHLTEPEVSDGTLLQGAWLQNGDLVGEYFQPNGFKILDADELLVLIVLAECVGRREHNYTHHITRVYRERAQTDAKVVIRNSSRGPLTTFIGIFDDKMNEDKMLQETGDRLLSKAAITNAAAHRQLEGLPSSLICSYASRVGDIPSPSCRTLAYLNPLWKSVVASEVARLKLQANAKETQEQFWWRELCRFASHRHGIPTDCSISSLSTDYKQENELLTFVQHVRGSVQLVSLCIGLVQTADMVILGDTLASAMLTVQ